MREMSKEMLKDNLIESLGLPASEFFLDKGVRGAAKLIKNNVPKLQNNDFINDVQESGLKDAIGNKIAGVKKTVEGKVNDALGDVKNRVEDVKNRVEDVKNSVKNIYMFKIKIFKKTLKTALFIFV
jgi:uncharacterized protein YjbJ (UPF0337 family)